MDKTDLPRRIDFVSLARADLPLVMRWLAEPHVRRFYREPFATIEDALAYFGPSIRGEEPTLLHIARLDATPFGFIQGYRLLDYPDYASLLGVSDGVSVDLYIGEPALVGQRLGRAMLNAYLARIVFPAYPAERRAYIAHALDNAAAMACSVAVGFRPLRQVIEEGVVEQLLQLERSALR